MTETVIEPVVGGHVILVDPRGKEHDALVTAVWSPAKYETPPHYGPVASLNLVYVSEDENARDQYGRQLAERVTSVVHESAQPAHGNYWKHA